MLIRLAIRVRLAAFVCSFVCLFVCCSVRSFVCLFGNCLRIRVHIFRFGCWSCWCHQCVWLRLCCVGVVVDGVDFVFCCRLCSRLRFVCCCDWRCCWHGCFSICPRPLVCAVAPTMFLHSAFLFRSFLLLSAASNTKLQLPTNNNAGEQNNQRWQWRERQRERGRQCPQQQFVSTTTVKKTIVHVTSHASKQTNKLKRPSKCTRRHSHVRAKPMRQQTHKRTTKRRAKHIKQANKHRNAQIKPNKRNQYYNKKR